VDAVSELGRLVEGETRSQEGGLVEKPDKVLDSLVGLVNLSFLAELSNDRVVGVDFHCLLGHHVGGHRVVTESLSFHNTFHVSGPAVLGGN